MINRLDLRCFKCFEFLKLPLGQLTLLSGANASGKSSVLQALALLHQTMQENEWSTRLILNGDTIKLGNVIDVIDKINGRSTLEIGLVDDGQTYTWSFVGERSEMSMAVDSVVFDGTKYEKIDSLQFLLPPNISSGSNLSGRLCRLSYLTAERIGPKEIYPIEDRQTSGVVGAAGERAVSVLHWGKDNPVISELVIQGTPNTLFHQVSERMRLFFPGCALALQAISQASAVTLGLRTSEDTDFHRPVNVGFGLTQILPIVIAALSASKDDILLIENPEVHLHPAGQAMMGQFLADVSQAGVQVIVETHSDHVLNGIRRSVKKGLINPEKVAIHFFKPRLNSMPQVISPVIDITGNIDVWPDGFFDQFDKDMNYFAGWRE
ncbi:MAG: DUF3696 domain-containing protein [Candidatus Riflebacteria bacterium]|nr:DUF3696 domain-containing protein [Candidatus Riflebacteria bacterium]